MEYFSKKIQELRVSHNMTQEDLAEKLGVSRQAISKWEREEALPDLYNIKKIAEVFGISVDELIYEKKESINLISQNQPNKLSLILMTIS